MRHKTHPCELKTSDCAPWSLRAGSYTRAVLEHISALAVISSSVSTNDARDDAHCPVSSVRGYAWASDLWRSAFQDWCSQYGREGGVACTAFRPLDVPSVRGEEALIIHEVRHHHWPAQCPQKENLDCTGFVRIVI